MIGKISGRIDARMDDAVLVDVGGIGYIVHCSDRTLSALPAIGEFAALYTDLLVREDLLQLFGFLSPMEREWHRLLLTVQGVGAKAALAIQGALGADGVSRAIALGDWNAIKAAKGIGPKTAQRVVNELRDKAPGVMAMGAVGGTAGAMAAPQSGRAAVTPSEPAAASASATAPAAVADSGAAQSEALSALGNLGYAPADAAGAVARAATDLPDADTAELIRAALKLLAPKG